MRSVIVVVLTPVFGLYRPECESLVKLQKALRAETAVQQVAPKLTKEDETALETFAELLAQKGW